MKFLSVLVVIPFFLIAVPAHSAAAEVSAVGFQVLRVTPNSSDPSLIFSAPTAPTAPNEPAKLIEWMEAHGTINIIAEGTILLNHGVGSISTMKAVEPTSKAKDLSITPLGLKAGMELKVAAQPYNELVVMGAEFELAEQVGVRSYTSPDNKSIIFPVLNIYRVAPNGMTKFGEGLTVYSYRDGQFTILVLKPMN